MYLATKHKTMIAGKVYEKNDRYVWYPLLTLDVRVCSITKLILRDERSMRAYLRVCVHVRFVVARSAP